MWVYAVTSPTSTLPAHLINLSSVTSIDAVEAYSDDWRLQTDLGYLDTAGHIFTTRDEALAYVAKLVTVVNPLVAGITP